MEHVALAARDLTTLHQPRRGTARPTSKIVTALLGLGVATTVMTLSGPAAQAAPPAAVSDQPTVAEAEAELERLQQSVVQAEETLQRLTIEAEAVADANLVAQAQLAAARQEADARAAELAAAQAVVGQAQGDVAALGRDSYMAGRVESYGTAAAFMGADDPGEVLDRAATLAHLGDDRAEQLDELEVAERQQQAVTEAATGAAQARDEAARRAADAERAANERRAAAQQAFDAAVADKLVLEQQLQEARDRVQLLGGTVEAPPPSPGATAGAVAGAQAGPRAVTGEPAGPGAGIPTTGRVTSCYGARWGTMHQGVDIAAPIGTPIYAPQAATVLQAGPAAGFGLAVYLQHDDGSITVYGHINSFSVTAGERISAGQQIAEVGNRGQSTGSHLHFEVHLGGLYQNRTDPAPWLAARGFSLGSAC